MKRYPPPLYARRMSMDEIVRLSPIYFMHLWQFYAFVAVFGVLATYFPWSWVADYAVAQALVVTMERAMPSVAALTTGTHMLPVDAVKAKWSFVHLVCGFLVFYKLVCQKPAVHRETPKLRAFMGVVCAGAIATVFLLFFFLSPKAFHDNGPDWAKSSLGESAWVLFSWWCFAFASSLAWSFWQDLLRRYRFFRMVKRQGSGQGCV